jgi:hypothetical protein
MILSHAHRFIFLKTNKTAGTSIEIALSKFCGPDDIITPVWPPDEETRKSLGYRGAQNYLLPFSEYSPRDWIAAALDRSRVRFYNHMRAHQVKRRVSAEVWNSYFKFCFERNPWDRVLSHYAWRCRREPRPTLSEFIATDMSRELIRRGIEVYTIDGHVAVDRVCRYENLAAELEFVQKHLNLPERIELPRAKGSFRADRRHYRDVLSPQDRDTIAAVFRREIEMHGYVF